MARKNRSIAGFDKVASQQEETGVTSQEEQVNATQEGKSDAEMPKTEVKPARGSALDALMSNKKETIQMGFYIEKDLADVLNGLQKQGGRGTNSKIVNRVLREFFEEEGLL